MRGDFTLFLSGVEPMENFNAASSVTQNVLLSYYYIRRRGIDEIEERLGKHRGMKILLDSGAFTFFKDPKYAKKSVDWWEKYLQNYVAFIRTHREHIFACVELDIDALVGSDVVNAWREKYFYPLEEEGINVIYLYHLDKDTQHFEELCKKHAYVGFSYVEFKNTLEGPEIIHSTITNLFSIAKKYHSAIHGFAITGNTLLLEFPFFSADSTSYLVGSQFGKITYFEGGRLHHLEKEDWKRNYLEKLKALGLNKKLLEIESPYELIRANAISYKKFEEYLRSLMRPQKYWEGRITTKYKLPALEWFEGDMEDWQEKLTEAGIDTNVPENVGKTLLKDFANIAYNSSELSSYTLEDLVEICCLFNAQGINYNTKDKCLKFLKQAVAEHLDGKRTDLQDLQRPADTERLALEREHYIQEKESIEIELSKEECGKLLPALLTAGYDKDSVEKELIENGITPVYDKEGNILKGIKTLKKQKKLSTKATPRLSCDRCLMASSCPEYQAGYICAWDKTFRKFNTRDAEDVMQGLTAIADLSLERAQKAFMQETVMGGAPTKATSQALRDAWEYLSKLQQLSNEVSGAPTVVSQTKIKGGVVEQTVVKGSNPQQNSILASILLDDEDTIDAEVIKEDK